MIYLDHNATTAPRPEAVEALTTCLKQTWGNPSSQHLLGQTAKRALATARSSIAKFLGAKPSEIVFTSGATEANHMAVHGALALSDSRHLLASAVEHAGFHKMLRLLPDAKVHWIPVKASGALDLTEALRLMRDDLALVSVMAANNETGVLMPLKALSDAAHAHGTLLHVDATQWIGKLPFSFAQSGADLVTLSAHKFGGPKGVGVLLVRAGLDWPATLVGTQERGRRGGTENLPGIVGLAAACDALMKDEPLTPVSARVGALRDALESGLLRALPGTHVWGAASERLPNTSLLRFGSLPAELVLQRLERLGVIASSGAACASSGTEPSHVLSAMGVPRDEALCAIRLSLGAASTESDIRQVLALLPPVLAPLMAQAEAEARAVRSPQTEPA